MKKTVVEMFFLSDCNVRVAPETPRYVYRHCTTLPPFKIKRLTTKLKVGLTRLLVGVFARLAASYFQQDSIMIVSRLNGNPVSVWHCHEVMKPLDKMLKEMTLTKKMNDTFPDIDTLAVRIEVKIIKYKILISFYYPEDFSSDFISAELLLQYEKAFREILKVYQ